MNCEWVKANVALYAYDELGDDARFELERHIQRCPGCEAELKSLTELREVMSSQPVLEPTPNLLAASRMRLQEALETAEQRRGWVLALDPSVWLRQLKFSPALAAILVIAGFGGGIGASWRLFHQAPGVSVPAPTATTPAYNAEASISGIRSITQQPGTNQVEINYDTVVPQKAEGSLNDQKIQQLLLYAARSNYNPGVRQDAVDTLAQKPDEAGVRKALESSLLYDSNPAVRLKALEALSPYVKDDTTVRDVILQALQSDQNPGVRVEAIRILQPVKADATVRGVLQELATRDQSLGIRKQAKRTLDSVPEID